MVRTKATQAASSSSASTSGGTARRAVAEKAPRKLSAASNTARAGAHTTPTASAKETGLNQICPRPTPDWQKSILSFFGGSTTKSKDIDDDQISPKRGPRKGKRSKLAQQNRGEEDEGEKREMTSGSVGRDADDGNKENDSPKADSAPPPAADNVSSSENVSECSRGDTDTAGDGGDGTVDAENAENGGAIVSDAQSATPAADTAEDESADKKVTEQVDSEEMETGCSKDEEDKERKVDKEDVDDSEDGKKSEEEVSRSGSSGGSSKVDAAVDSPGTTASSSGSGSGLEPARKKKRIIVPDSDSSDED